MSNWSSKPSHLRGGEFRSSQLTGDRRIADNHPACPSQPHGGDRGRNRYRYSRYSNPQYSNNSTGSHNSSDLSRIIRRQNQVWSGNSQRQTNYSYANAKVRHEKNNYVQRNRDIEEDNSGSDPLNLPGYVYDEATRKHYLITNDSSGIAGFTRSDIARARRERERRAQIAANRPRFASGSFSMRPVIQPISCLMNELSLGTRRHSYGRIERQVAECRLLNVQANPNYIQETPLGSSGEHVMGCQFLDVSDGDRMFGCWAVGNGSRNSRLSSRMVCLRAVISEARRRASKIELDRRSSSEIQTPLNTMGLEFVVDGETAKVSDPALVDMTVAPVDSDVTCVLYVTAASRLTANGVNTFCKIFVQPVAELSSEECCDILSSPIYNIYWSANASIYSCAWNANKMRIALGLEDSAKIIDVVSEQHFIISSKRKNVISQEFTHDGNLIYMGLRDCDVIRSDLRMKCRHVTGKLKGSRSSGWIKLLKTALPECILTENFNGELKLWDARRTDRELLSFKGHRNSHYRLPCFVDSAEKFVFAVGNDGCTRGWSLSTGDLLCEVPSPRPVEDRTDFPRVVYSDCWGGRIGNAAMVLAVGDSLRVHQLEL